MAMELADVQQHNNVLREFNELLWELVQNELRKQTVIVRKFPENVLALHRQQVLVEGIKAWTETDGFAS